MGRGEDIGRYVFIAAVIYIQVDAKCMLQAEHLERLSVMKEEWVITSKCERVRLGQSFAEGWRPCGYRWAFPYCPWSSSRLGLSSTSHRTIRLCSPWSPVIYHRRTVWQTKKKYSKVVECCCLTRNELASLSAFSSCIACASASAARVVSSWPLCSDALENISSDNDSVRLTRAQTHPT